MKKRIVSLFMMLTMIIALIPCANAAEIVDSGKCSPYYFNITWTLYDDGSLIISGDGQMTWWDIYSDEVPWYKHRTSIITVVINSGVTNLPARAFEDCTSLSDISIPDSISYLDARAFDNCTNLKNIFVDENNSYFSDVDGVLFSKNKESLMKYPSGKTETICNIPEYVSKIGNFCFSDCINLTDVIIPDSVEYIGAYTFSGCKNIKNMFIPENADINCQGTFSDCGKLNISVDYNNQKFSSVDGVLFNKDQTTLISYAKDEIHPDYTIPDTVTKIGDRAFLMCENLKSIFLSDNITNIENNAFYGCNQLQNVYYLGTEDQWNNNVYYWYHAWTPMSSVSEDVFASGTVIHYNAKPTINKNETVVKKDSNKYTFNVHLTDVNYDSSLITILYDINGSMTGIAVTPLSAGDEEKEISMLADGADNAKIFIWSSVQSIRPLCDSFSTEITPSV